MGEPEWKFDLPREVKEVFPKEVVQSADLETKESVFTGRTCSEPCTQAGRSVVIFEELREGQWLENRRWGCGL